MKTTTVHIDSDVALGCKIGRAYQILLSQLDSALKDAGIDITTSEYLVLRAVNSREGMQQCEIARLVGKDKASVCRCVAGLEKRGLLTTEAESHKCLKVFLTRESELLMPRIMDVARARHKALMDLSTPAQLNAFIQVLDKIIETKND